MKRIAICLFIAIYAICLCGSYANAQVSNRKSGEVRDERDQGFNCSYSGCFIVNGVSYAQTIFSKSGEEASVGPKEKYVFHCPTEKSLRENGIRAIIIRYSFASGEGAKGYYVREFVDTARGQAIAVEYGSTETGFLRDDTRKAYFLQLDTLTDYQQFGQANNITSKLLFNKSDGSYAYELFNGKALFGLRYYSALNHREYYFVLK